MPADESFDQQQPISLLAMLAARYPHWTIWYGQATRHWWALPPHGEPPDRFVEAVNFIEAVNVKELVESIEVIQARRGRPSAPPAPGGILFGEAETSRAGQVPAAAWPGGRR